MNAKYIIQTSTNIIIKSSTTLTSHYSTLTWRLRKIDEGLIWKRKTFPPICDCRLRIGNYYQGNKQQVPCFWARNYGNKGVSQKECMGQHCLDIKISCSLYHTINFFHNTSLQPTERWTSSVAMVIWRWDTLYMLDVSLVHKYIQMSIRWYLFELWFVLYVSCSASPMCLLNVSNLSQIFIVVCNAYLAYWSTFERIWTQIWTQFFWNKNGWCKLNCTNFLSPESAMVWDENAKHDHCLKW